jgi:hypothetical protein
MGMGGGTLLIPLLNFLPLKQHTIQAINLISFVPMCAAALVFHAKNGLLKTYKLGYLILPALVAGILGAYLTKYAGQEILRYCFGVLLIGLGVWQFILAVKSIKEKKKENIKEK